MSSRWDALKPRGNDSEKKGGSRHKELQSSRGATKADDSKEAHSNFHRQDRLSDSSRGSFAGRPRQKPNSWRTSTDTDAAKSKGEVQVSFAQRSKSDDVNTSALSTWEKLTRDLWEWGDHSPTTTGGLNEKRELKGAYNTSEALRIIQQLSSILETQSTRKIISGRHRGNALAATLHALNFFNDKESIQQVLRWSCLILSLSDEATNEAQQFEIRITAQQAQNSILGLLKSQSFVEGATDGNEHAKCCLCMVRYCASQLPAEETAHQVVGKIMLPAMEQSLKGLDDGRNGKLSKSLEPINSKIQGETLHLGLQALQTLLQVKNQSSALFAPLVNDVSSEGKEVHIFNPLRKRIFLLLQNAIEMNVTNTSSQLSKDITMQLFSCLEAALNMASIVDKSTSSPSSKQGLSARPLADLDVTVMEKFFKQNLQSKADRQGYVREVKQSHRNHVLRLLFSLLRNHPGASLSIGRVLLLPDVPSSSLDRTIGMRSKKKGTESSLQIANCACCASSASTFLTDIHNSKGPEEGDLGVASLAMLVKHIPWRLWLGKKFPQTQRRVSATSNFGQRVAGVIRSIVTIANCLFSKRFCSPGSQRSSRNANSIVDLVKACLLDIPYDCFCEESEQNKTILEAACDLVENISRMLIQEDRYHYPLKGRFCEIFEESMGGRTTPQGTRTEMIIPARTWLSSPSSSEFLNGLSDALNRGAKAEKLEETAKVSAKLLRSILVTRPETVLASKTDWDTFQRIILTLSESRITQLQQTGLQLLDGFLLGRNYSSPAVSVLGQEEVVAFILQLLPRSLQQGSGSCRCLCLQAYGAMLGSDWFLSHSGDDMRSHLDNMMQCCLGTEPSSVRSAACKCLGDLCSNCFLPAEQSSRSGVSDLQVRHEILKSISRDVCVTLLEALKDSNASVRAMAIFALGNLAQVISCSASTDMMDSRSLKESCVAAFDCRDDANDKVAGNGIRCVGHLAVVILRPDYSLALKQIGWNVEEFCRQSVCWLVQLVEAVPACVVGDRKLELSWKQRSVAKKHGRVACNTLVLFMKHWSVSDITIECIREALCSVVNCLESLGTALDDKFIIAATHVVRALPSSSLAKVSGKKCFVGKALVPCIHFIAQQKWHRPVQNPTSRILEEVEELCKHLLDSVSIGDAGVVIMCEQIADAWMEDLYQWMVLNHCTSGSFDAFAIALQKPEIQTSVAVENLFANRAMNLLRHEELMEPDSDDEL